MKISVRSLGLTGLIGADITSDKVVQMPRGQNLNSKKNLKNRFNTDSAKKAAQKSAEARKAYSSAREALKDYMTDDKYKELMEALHKRGKAGNLTAIDMIFKYTDPINNNNSPAEGVDDEESGVVMLPERTDGNA